MGQGDNRTYEEIFGKEEVKSLKAIRAARDIAEAKYKKDLKVLRDSCNHNWQRICDPCGDNYYECTKCEKTKD